MTDDTLAISNIISRFSHLIDARDYGGLGELFADISFTTAIDGVEGRSEPVRGDEIADWYKHGAEISNRNWLKLVEPEGDPADVRTRHVFTNIVIEVAEDRRTAAAVYYGMGWAYTSNVSPRARYAGRYHDTFERRDGTWRIIARHQVHDYSPTVRN